MTMPSDPALPHLAHALDGASMAPAFAALIGERWQLQRCTVDRIKYRPGRNCTLSYGLELADRRSGAWIRQRVAARLCGADAERRHQRALAASGAPSPAGPAVHLLRDLALLTWWWPNDAKLGEVRLLDDHDRLHAAVLPPLVTLLSQGVGQLTEHRMAIAQYVPEHRVTACFDLAWRQGARTVTQQVYAKASREPDSAAAHGILKALQHSPAWQRGRLRTPAALLCQPTFGLHWQEAVPGVPWIELTPARAHTLARPLGEQLAALHATRVATDRCLTPDVLLQRLHDVVTVLGPALPGSRAALDRANRQLEQGLQRWGALPPNTLHGDLHPRNVLVHGDRLSLIDLDGLRCGPAVLELGAWQAEGIYRALLDGAAPLRDRAGWVALIDGYANAGGTRPDAAALLWATAWNLLTQRAWRCVVNLKPGRLAVAPALVSLAAELSAASREAA